MKVVVLALGTLAVVLATGWMTISTSPVDTQPAAGGVSTSGLSLTADDRAALRAGQPPLIVDPDRRQAPSTVLERVLDDAARRAAEPALLQLRHGDIDPLAPAFKSAPDPLGAVALPKTVAQRIDRLSTRTVQALQFAHPLTVDDRLRIEAAGGDIVGYIPNQAFLVAWPKGATDTRDALPGLRWSGVLPLSSKLDPELKAALELGLEDTSEPLLLEVSAFRDEDMNGWDELVRAAGADDLRYLSSNGLPRMMVEVTGEHLATVAAALARLAGVENLRLYTIPKLKNYGSIWLLQSGDSELEATPLFDAGLTGWGQIYGSADSGLDTDACQFRLSGRSGAQTLAQSVKPPKIEISNPDDKVIAYYILPGSEAYDETSGNYHGTMTSGCAVGDNYLNPASADSPGLDKSDGMAPAAQIVFQDGGNSAGFLVGLSFSSPYDLNLQAYLSGARVHNNSYGREGSYNAYDSSSQEIDRFMWDYPDYLVVFAAGNAGPREGTLGGEGSTAKNTLAVGASMPGWYEGGKDLISFSSRGPTTDGRLKPDLVAPGLIESATEIAPRKLDGVTNVWGNPAYESSTVPPNDQCAVDITSGTSFSSPTAAGMALLVRQYFTDGYYPGGERNADDAFIPSSALIRAVMLNSSRALAGDVLGFNGGGTEVIGDIDPPPSTHQGWGVITLNDALYLKGDHRDLEVLADIANGTADAITQNDNQTYTLKVRSGDELKISLVWIDPPGSAGSGKALVNDLDLVVEAPNGDVYFGNRRFNYGQSSPVLDNTEPDRLNSHEQVILGDPDSGDYTLHVIGASVPGTGSVNAADSQQQGYALIATGDLGQGDEQLLPRITLQRVVIGGGCDNDVALDKNETVTAKILVINSGDGAAEAMSAQVSVVEDETDIDPELILLPNDGLFDVPRMEARSRLDFGLKIGLINTDADICGGSATFAVVISDADGQAVRETSFTIPLGKDYLEDGTILCQTELCNPPATITEVIPHIMRPGQVGLAVVMKGSYLSDDLSIEFDPPVLECRELEVRDSREAVYKGCNVLEDAEIGPVAILAANEDDPQSRYEDLLELQAAGETDGDVDGADGDGDTITPEKDGGGCRSAQPGTVWLWWTLLLLPFMRRRVRS